MSLLTGTYKTYHANANILVPKHGSPHKSDVVHSPYQDGSPLDGEASEWPNNLDGVNNSEAVTIRDTSTRRGLGVFVTGDFRKNHKIIVERPVMTCTPPAQKNETSARKKFTQEWCSLPPEDQKKLKSQFIKMRHVPVGRDTLTLLQSIHVLNFVREYAFCNPQRSLVHIYALGSHINHACRRCANAEQWTESAAPHRIIVKLVKPLKAGDEVFISYNRRVGMSFGCAVCGLPSKRTRLEPLCNKLARWLSGFTTRKAEAEVKAKASRTTNAKSTAQANTWEVYANRCPYQNSKRSKHKAVVRLRDKAVVRLRDKAVGCWRFLFTRREGPESPVPASQEEQ